MWLCCTQAAICFCRHGKCKAQQLCITYCFHSPSRSLYFFAETANKGADAWLCRCRCAQRQGGQSRPSCLQPQHGPAERSGARRRGEHPGLCCVSAHESPCDGAKRASFSAYLRAGHTAGTGSGTGFRQEQVGCGVRLGTGSSVPREGRCSRCRRRLDSFGSKSLAEPAQTKAEETRCGSGTRGVCSFLSVQFFPSCERGL